MNKLLKKSVLFVFVASLLVMFMYLTNPDDLPLAALFIPFILVYILLYLIFREVGQVLLGNIRPDHRKWIVGTVSAVPVGLLLTISAGQTGANDIVLFGVLVILLLFYFNRTNFLK